MPNHAHPIVRLLVSALALTVLAGQTLAEETHWYVVQLGGQKAGHMVERETTNDKGQLVTSEEVVFQVSRMKTNMQIKMQTEFVETPEGKPISMKSVQELGSVPIEQNYLFKEDGLERTTTQNGQTTNAKLAKPEGEWLTPAAAERFIKERMRAKAKEIKFRVVDPSAGHEPVSATRGEFKPEAIKVQGRAVEATKATIDKLRADRTKVRDEIGRRFPSYAELIDPQPPSVDQIKEALADGEAMLSFYFGRNKSFV